MQCWQGWGLELCSSRCLVLSKDMRSLANTRPLLGKSDILEVWFRRSVYWHTLGCLPGNAWWGCAWFRLRFAVLSWGNLDTARAASATLTYQFSATKLYGVSKLKTCVLLSVQRDSKPCPCCASRVCWLHKFSLIRLCSSVPAVPAAVRWDELPGPSKQCKGSLRCPSERGEPWISPALALI